MAIPVLNDLSFRDGVGLRLGDSDELKLFHNSSGYSYLQTTGGEDFRLLNATNDKDIAFYTTTSSTSSAQLTLHGDTKVSAFNGGDVTIDAGYLKIETSDSSSGRIYLGKASGTQGNSLIDSCHSLYVDYGTSSTGLSYLHIQSDGTDSLSLSPTGAAVFRDDVTLANGKALRWTSDDVKIEGTTSGDNLTFDVGASTILTLAQSGTLATFAGDVKVTGSIMRGSITTATDSSNTHTCTLADNDNFNIAVANAATTIALTVVSADIGKSGMITITNPASVGSLSFVALPSYMLTPSGATVNFVTTANAVSVISYYVLATDKVLCNYIGNFA